MDVTTEQNLVEQRARQSLGTSSRAIYATVAGLLKRLSGGGGRICDVGCGAGLLFEFVSFDSYVGVDVVRYEGFPSAAEFVQANLDDTPWPIADNFADVTVSVETIEHLENPRALFRELKRITRPGGLIVVTTPNQLSFLSKLTLLVKDQFNAFQASSYPAHLTALLKVDLERMANECGLQDLQVIFTNSGRIPGPRFHWPRPLGGQRFSDNIAIAGRKPPQPQEAR